MQSFDEMPKKNTNKMLSESLTKKIDLVGPYKLVLYRVSQKKVSFALHLFQSRTQFNDERSASMDPLWKKISLNFQRLVGQFHSLLDKTGAERSVEEFVSLWSCTE